MHPEAPPSGPPRRPWLFWPAVVVALGLVVGGAVTAVAGYAGTRGPAGAVRGYFAALQRSDAPSALGFGDVPSGPRQLLRSAVLREQQRVAPIVELRVGTVRRAGSRAEVAVSYVLRYRTGDAAVSARIPVHDADGGWRLDAAAVRTRLQLGSASQRASVLGRTVPVGEVLAFPGAPPLRFDSDYLALEPDVGILPTGTAARVFSVTLTGAGRAAAQGAVLAALRHCLARPDPTCPLPAGRYLPGSVRGSVDGKPANVQVSLFTTQVGTLEFTADVPVLASSYRRLDFLNRVSTGHGRLTLAVHAIAVVRPPLTVAWLAP